MQLPHKEKTGFAKVAAAIGPKLIAGAATAGIGAGLAQAGSQLLQDTGLDSIVNQVQGGFGPASGGASVLQEDGGMSLFGSGGTLDDIFGGLSKAGQYAQSAGESLANFKAAFGGHGGGGGGGGGGASGGDMGPMLPAPQGDSGGAMQKALPWLIGGGALLLVLLFMSKGRR
jgi:hypothetical protein